MSTEESRSPTFDGTEAAERSGGKVADVSGIDDKQPDSSDTGQDLDQPERPDEAAQIIP